MASATFQSAFLPTLFDYKIVLSGISAYQNGTGIFTLLKDKSWCLSIIGLPCMTSPYDNLIEIFPLVSSYVECTAVYTAFIV